MSEIEIPPPADYQLVLREFIPELLAIAHDWWRRQGWPELALDALPLTGLMVSSDGIPVCMGWFYKTDSTFGIMEWIVANPDVRGERRHAALDLLVHSLLAVAKNQGFKFVFTSLKNQSLKERLEKAGFQPSDDQMTNLIWRG